METELTHLKGSQQEAEQTCTKQKLLLAETRQKAKQRLEKDIKEMERLRVQLEASNVELEESREREEKVSVNIMFGATMHIS